VDARPRSGQGDAPALVDLVRAEPVGPALPATAPAGPVPTQAAGGISHPDKLLAAILARVENAPDGSRRVTLYGAARGVAKMVAAGAIGYTDAVAKLTDVGRKAEQTDRDIRRAIDSGFRHEGVSAA
jgi:hypothetical protein